jgi:hypothetical protein
MRDLEAAERMVAEHLEHALSCPACSTPVGLGRSGAVADRIPKIEPAEQAQLALELA